MGVIEINSVYVYGVDGEYIEQNIIDFFELSSNDFKYDKKTNRYRYDFVGFVFKKEKILTVFPKHFYENSDIYNFNSNEVILKDDIKLLYESIQKYSRNSKTNVKANRYIGIKDDYESDYPFNIFYNIYDYYRRYGLYKEKEQIIKEGTHGKISWKKTIQKSQVIISNDNLFFMPLYVKKYNMLTGFITDCMAFIIDYTINHFSDFIALPRTHYKQNNFDYFNNIDYVIRRLQEIKRKIHKDIDRELVSNLILFFLQYKAKCRGGRIHIKINYFDIVWQNAVEEYLNSFFVGFDKKNQSIIFNTSKAHSSVNFKKKRINVDDSKNQFEIELDHFAIDGSFMYIFDSKYYYELDKLNYKQYSYNELLRYAMPTITNIISVLILPGNTKSDIHFSLKSSFTGSRTMGNEIYEQYISVNQVLKNYIK